VGHGIPAVEQCAAFADAGAFFALDGALKRRIPVGVDMGVAAIVPHSALLFYTSRESLWKPADDATVATDCMTAPPLARWARRGLASRGASSGSARRAAASGWRSA
jgi:hypothetical protein